MPSHSNSTYIGTISYLNYIIRYILPLCPNQKILKSRVKPSDSNYQFLGTWTQTQYNNDHIIILHTYVRSTVQVHTTSQLIQSVINLLELLIRKYLILPTTYLPTYLPTYIFSIPTYRMVPTYIPMVPNPKKGPRNMQDLGFSVFERFYIHMQYKGSPK